MGWAKPPGRKVDAQSVNYMNRPVGRHDAEVSVPEPADEAVDEMAGIETRQFQVEAEAHGLRLDKWLASRVPEFSRSHLQHLIAEGQVRSGVQALASASRKVVAGLVIDVTLLPTAQSSAFRPEPIALDIRFEDAALLIVHKPAGLVVHPAAGNWSGTLLNGLLAHHAGAAALPRAGIVHRLDKDTSGLMVVARTLAAQTALVRAIAAREVRREYLALVHGRPDAETFSVETPIGRDPVARVRMAVVAGAKPARTDVTVLATAVVDGQTVSAVRCRLHTGRTHQIRVHLAHRGHPLLGDTLYGGRALLGVMRQALHATRLGLVHPDTGQALLFEAPVPADLRAAWHAVTG